MAGVSSMDDVAILRVETIGTDAIGNEIKTYTDKQVFVKTRGVTRREFYDAQQAGLRPSLVLVLSNRADYAGEKLAVFHGIEYTVLRTYWTDDGDEIELTLEERVANYGG